MKDLIPSEFFLSQNYPNPFKNITTIKYCLPYKTLVKLTIFNSEREVIDNLVDEVKIAGSYEVEFSGNDSGEGVFYFRFEAGNYIVEKKMLKIR